MNEISDKDGYFKLIRALQEKCAELSWHRIPELGAQAPTLVEALDVLLSFLERAATCFGGCHGGDHRAEFLTGRAVSSCQAAMLLLTNGYYDEALSIIRSLGEIANLMAMFVQDKSQFERWKTLDEKERQREFSPVKIRCWLDDKGAPLVVDQGRYKILSAYSVHASPDTMPQAHGPHGNASIGPFYQEAGLLLCLNELARPMAFIAVYSARLIRVPVELKDVVDNLSRVLVEHIGAVSADASGRPWFSLN